MMVLRAKVYKNVQTSSRDLGTALITGSVENATATSADIIGQGYGFLRLTGVNLVHDNAGQLIAGTVAKVEKFDGSVDNKIISISGFNFDIGPVANAPNALLEQEPRWDLDCSYTTDAGLANLGVVFVTDNWADTIAGSQFNDRFHAEDGKDSVVGGVGRDSLDGGAGKDTLEGGDGGDYFFGGRGNDEIDGDGGADMIISTDFRGKYTFNGAQSIDLATGRHTGESVGSDRVYSIESFYAGNGNDTINGSDRANTLIGGHGDDIINGKGGRDEIWSGGGRNTVSGGAGADVFVFEPDMVAGSDYTKITDFQLGKDKIGIVHHSLSHPGPLPRTYFHAGTSAQDEFDHFIYSRAKGRLWWDSDGDGDIPKQLIATFNTKPALTADDITIMSYSGDWWLA
jgi:Ca2+-binding RTX toxin-like protein